MEIDGKPHPHSFYRDGDEVRVVEAVTREGQGSSIRSKIEKLLVLKSTGSAFHGFHRDEYTRLPETWDRILSTEIEAGWQWKLFKTLEEVKAIDFNGAWKAARDITMKIFAEDDSASVQATMYKMADTILATVPQIDAVDYALPNKHYFEIGKLLLIKSRPPYTNTLQTSHGTRTSRTLARTRPSSLPSPIPTV
jgi:urate oxidase